MNRDLNSYDTKNLYKVLAESWLQADAAWKGISIKGIDKNKISNIIVTGLGGSAISGDLLKNYLNNELKVPFAVNRSYHLPQYAGKDTLVIASSYSGNTEETLSAFKSAVDRGCAVIALTTGGEIGRLASEKGVTAVKLMEGYQPRYALYNSFFTLLRVMQELQLVDAQDDIVQKIILMLQRLNTLWGSENGDAYKTAVSLKGFIPVIYSVTDINDSVGRRFKGQLNENSKVHAWSAEYPEMNHNEIVGWETAASSALKYKAVTFHDDDVFPRIKKRIDIINKLLVKEKIDILTIKGAAETFKERLIEVVYFCDWVTYYLALLNEKDPGEIDFIHFLKKRMAEG